MFAFAIIVGLYSYIIFFLGIFGFLNEEYIAVSLLFIVFLLFIFRKRFEFRLLRFSSSLEKVCIIILMFQATVNLVGALGPELGFDALWYHLTLPKLYLKTGTIEFIPGGLLYYSTMPKLAEMLYAAALSIGNEVSAKLIHYMFGILSLVALYKAARHFVSKELSLLCVLFFYSNLVVGWESMTAYVDLARTFFEVLALWSFILWMQKKKTKWLIMLGIMIGLAITTKLVAMQSLLIYAFLVFSLSREKLKNMFMFVITSLIVPLPWFIFSYLSTGNPFYPLFTNFYVTTVLEQNFVQKLVDLFIYPEDPISPLYLGTIPLILVTYKFFSKELKAVSIFVLIATIFWVITPHTGGTRFFIPYLPAFSIICIAALEKIKSNKRVYIATISLIIFISISSVIYRGIANARYMPVLIGRQSKEEFLTKNLNFSYGDFYDVDNYFKKNIKSTDKVLLYGFHNLYYVDFPFVHESWTKKVDHFTYIAVQGQGELPKRFDKLPLVYENRRTNVRVYGTGQLTYY